MGRWLLAMFRALPLVVKVLTLVPLVAFFLALTPQGRPLIDSLLFHLPPRGLLDLAAAPLSMLLYPREALFALLFDLLVFVQLGALFARRWRTAHFLTFVLLCHLGGLALAWGLGPLMGERVAPRAFGLGAPVLGLFLAFALVFGQQYFRIPGLQKPVQGRKLFWALFAFAFVLFLLGNDPWFVQRLGGALMAALLLTGAWRPHKASRYLREAWQKLRWKWRRRRFKVLH